ncbi:HNH endonuclease [Gordonia desulfuricans]|uniref:HNH endonuclease n=1 Tax=Gordonia desulfuricans TaxID=89051 RepID=A0A7K3LNC3_9ACTN|nr:HNH endonuclease [Gordonia desulfuricans]NDK89735.1 HNH endonuclease [Gordonia desulfuricans]
MTVFVTNAGLQILARVTWRRAAILLTTDVARNMEGTPLVRVVHSPTLTLPIHRVVAIKHNAYRPYAGKTMESHASSQTILRRDQWICAYCEGPADTVDHIVPQSRGGASTFGNQVAACRSCNGFKADRTPREAGMAMRHAPFVHDPWAADQKEVWELFALGARTP